MTMLFPVALLGVIAGVFCARLSRRFFRDRLPKELDRYWWIAGIILLLINGIILGMVVVGYLLALFRMPLSFTLTLYWVISFGAPFLSVYVWLTVKFVVGGGILKRFGASVIGQSVYLGLLIFFISRMFTKTPDFPGADMFMRTASALFGMLICFSAALIGIIALTSPMPKR